MSSVRIDDETADAMRVAAAVLGVQLQAAVSEACRDWLETHDQEIREAIRNTFPEQ